jgi:hypothetical protein
VAYQDQDFICSWPISQPVPGMKSGGRQVYRLCSDVVIHLAGYGHLIVPVEFLWDGASVPRIFWRLFPSRGASDPAAALHDFIYASEMFSRAECDEIFRRVLRLVMSRAGAQIMYLAVRVGGGTWDVHTWKSVRDARHLAFYQKYEPMRPELLAI